MWRKRGKKSRERSDEAGESTYHEAARTRLERLKAYTRDFEETDAEEVEARIRRMTYGHKIEDDWGD